MEKGKVAHPTTTTQAEETKANGQAIDPPKEKDMVGINTMMNAHPPHPRINPNVAPPTKERRRLNSKENATTVAYTATNPVNVANDSRPKPKLITLEKQTTV